jgi:hypothetical protein
MREARVSLGVVGALALLIGGIVALAQKSAGDNAHQADLYARTLGGADLFTFDSAGPHYVAMWVGVVFTILGAVMLVGLWVAVAATPADPETVAGAPTPDA